MYTLRKVSTELGTSNELLGKFYTSVSRFENQVRFRELFKNVFNRDHVADLDESTDNNTKQVIGFIMTSTDSCIPIYDGDAHYIVTESGKTFDRLNKSITRNRVSKN